MRRFCISAVIALMTAATVCAESVKLTREECIDIALSTSPTIKIADLEVKRMEYAKRESQAGFYPTIDFQGA